MRSVAGQQEERDKDRNNEEDEEKMPSIIRAQISLQKMEKKNERRAR